MTQDRKRNPRQWAAAFACVVVAATALLYAGCGGPAQTPPETPEREQAAPPDEARPEEQAPEPAREVVLYRDTWGVPHIFAGTLPDAAYALGRAQAEDRLDDLYANVRTATGTMAEAFGADYVKQDYLMKLLKNAERSQEFWATAPEYLTAIGDRFMAGVRAYADEHPEQVPSFATELHGWQCAAIIQAMVLRWPLDAIQDDLRSKGEAPEFGSNGWAVAPSRSADGCAILLADPHQTWEGMSVFYEMRMHTPEHDLCGFCLVGTPLLALGHNANVAWAATTGGPDTSDVYMIKLNPANPMQYEYDGEWRTAEVVNFTIDVKDAEPVQELAAYTHLGPVIEQPDLERGIAYVAASPYFERNGIFELMYRLNAAGSCDEFYDALSMNLAMEQNAVFADRQGNICYVRTGATPMRPDGYNWSAPVPGNTSATAWQGLHDIADMVQVRNPVQGYIQNCNISPEFMMKDSPMTPDRYKDYIYNVSWDTQNPRGTRLLQLLDADDSITREEAMAIALDVYDVLAAPWQHALQMAAELDSTGRASDSDVAQAVADVLAWNGEYTPESRAALIMRFWRLKCKEAGVDCDALAEGRPLTLPDQTALLESLAAALAEIKERCGTLDVTWGTLHKVGRGGKLFPVPGGDYGRGAIAVETLFDVRCTENADGVLVADNGSMATHLTFLHKDRVESYTCVMWGQSADPGSPHYMDQGEKLFATRTFKPTWFDKDALMDYVASEATFTVP